MPIPSPGADEPKDDFMNRCISAISDEYPQDQAVAICLSKWNENLREQIEPAMWKYVAESDACELCQIHVGDEFETAEIWDTFPYAMPLFDNVIEPNVHPNCRCQLILIEEEKLKDIKKDIEKLRKTRWKV